MTLTDEHKILEGKIKANQVQYDLGREAAKISALSSKDLLEKYEYLTGQYLGHGPIVVEKTKFEYFQMRMSLNKSFNKDNSNSNKICYKDIDTDTGSLTAGRPISIHSDTPRKKPTKKNPDIR